MIRPATTDHGVYEQAIQSALNAIDSICEAGEYIENDPFMDDHERSDQRDYVTHLLREWQREVSILMPRFHAAGLDRTDNRIDELERLLLLTRETLGRIEPTIGPKPSIN